MIIGELREVIADMAGDDAVVFDNPSFDNSIIGVDDDGRVVYNFENMVEELMHDEKFSREDALDFIDYNTLGARSNFPNSPIVVYEIY